MPEEFAIPKHGVRTGLQEVNLNQGDAAGEYSRAGQAAAATAAAVSTDVVELLYTCRLPG
jgi:hypothetical protein